MVLLLEEDPGISLRSGLSVTPLQKLFDPIDLMDGDAAESIGEPSLRIDAVELGRFDQRVGNCSRSAATF